VAIDAAQFRGIIKVSARSCRNRSDWGIHERPVERLGEGCARHAFLAGVKREKAEWARGVHEV
jgi:hypothetical protein